MIIATFATLWAIGLTSICLIGGYIRYELNKEADRHARE